ncbi:PiggyBac transposable element-derived protein 3, partial [Stegodyphus mimosarum]
MCPLETMKCVRKKDRNYYDIQYEKKNFFVQLNDYLVLTVGSKFEKSQPIKSVSCYSRMQKKKVFVPQLHLIEQYNAKMGKVDLCNNLVAKYKIRVCGKK